MKEKNGKISKKKINLHLVGGVMLVGPPHVDRNGPPDVALAVSKNAGLHVLKHNT